MICLRSLQSLSHGLIKKGCIIAELENQSHQEINDDQKNWVAKVAYNKCNRLELEVVRSSDILIERLQERRYNALTAGNMVPAT